ncbi:hypothetical protein Ciccas_010063 [Cichlidogyrus casuarinus]|uniref:Uncharacterized protein n=1 Tax=Cichlidogyrus casuarinus TaxID=1844966 RepID=A0ABD2PV72_9PLAT
MINPGFTTCPTTRSNGSGWTSDCNFQAGGVFPSPVSSGSTSDFSSASSQTSRLHKNSMDCLALVPSAPLIPSALYADVLNTTNSIDADSYHCPPGPSSTNPASFGMQQAMMAMNEMFRTDTMNTTLILPDTPYPNLLLHQDTTNYSSNMNGIVVTDKTPKDSKKRVLDDDNESLDESADELDQSTASFDGNSGHIWPWMTVVGQFSSSHDAAVQVSWPRDSDELKPQVSARRRPRPGYLDCASKTTSPK